MRKLLTVSITLLTSIFFSACGIDDIDPPTFDYSKKLIGEWQLDRSFNLVDASMNPPAYDWFDVEEGYSLSLFDDNAFVYTRFGDCTSGKYTYDPILHKIEFFFDCEFEYEGEMIARFTEFLDQDKMQNDRLYLSSARASESCVINCSSVLKRIQ